MHHHDHSHGQAEKSEYIGFHCRQWDMRLMKEVIQIDIDTALRRLPPELGCPVDCTKRSEWCERIAATLEKDMRQAASAHMLLPSVVEEHVQAAIAELIDAYLQENRIPAPLRHEWLQPLFGKFVCAFRREVDTENSHEV